LLYKKTKQHGQGNVLENFEKKSSQFFEESYQIIKIFGQFEEISSFFLSSRLKSPYVLRGSCGLPTCNKIPTFFTSLFVL